MGLVLPRGTVRTQTTGASYHQSMARPLPYGQVHPPSRALSACPSLRVHGEQRALPHPA